MQRRTTIPINSFLCKEKIIYQCEFRSLYIGQWVLKKKKFFFFSHTIMWNFGTFIPRCTTKATMSLEQYCVFPLSWHLSLLGQTMNQSPGTFSLSHGGKPFTSCPTPRWNKVLVYVQKLKPNKFAGVSKKLKSKRSLKKINCTKKSY